MQGEPQGWLQVHLFDDAIRIGDWRDVASVRFFDADSDYDLRADVSARCGLEDAHRALPSDYVDDPPSLRAARGSGASDVMWVDLDELDLSGLGSEARALRVMQMLGEVHGGDSVRLLLWSVS